MLKNPISFRNIISYLRDSYIFLFILSVIIGIFIFNFFIKVPNIGVITIDTPIMDEETKEDIVKMLKYAREDNSIKAIVIKMNCPGGEVTNIEEIYLEVLRLRSKKPVVTSVDRIGLSGGYHIAAATNFIYAKPSSIVGSIGVVLTLSEPVEETERMITTGPYKRGSHSMRYYAGQAEMIKEVFLDVIVSQRGNRLKISRETLSEADDYLGIEGLKYGLVDEIGSRSNALEKAASYAGIANYGLVDINKKVLANNETNITSRSHSTKINQTSPKVDDKDTMPIEPVYYYLPIDYYLKIEQRKEQ